MLDLPWLHHIPTGTLEGAITRANRLYWALRVEYHEGRWVVFGGEDVLLRTDSHETLDAFLYGLGLAYGAIPDEAFEGLAMHIRQLVDPEEIDPPSSPPNRR